jgi:nitrogen fixation protein FixH
MKKLNPWPVSIIAFFAVAFIGFGIFIAYCTRHPADLIAADYYEQEVRYQGQIDRIQRAQQRSQQASLRYDPANKLIRISLPPNPFSATATGIIQFYRPSATDQDRQFNLQPDATGIQSIDASRMLPGLWKVRVTWTAGGQEYFLDEKVVIPK